MILPQHQLFAWAAPAQQLSGPDPPGPVAPFGVFFMTTYMRGIPRELDEAAMLDGASRWTIFWKIILPLTIPAQSTLAVFTFLGAWNDYWWPLISATRSDMYTLTVGLAAAQMNYAQTSGLGYLMAQAVFASIPIFIVYIVFQKQIVRAMAGTRGAMKRVAAALLALLALGSCAKSRSPDAPLSAALLRRMRRRIWRQHRRREGGRRVRDHHDARQSLQRREPRHPDRRQRRRLAGLSAADGASRRARPAGPRDDARRRDQRLCVEGSARAGRRLSCAPPGSSPSDFTEAARQGVTMYGHVYGLPWDTHGGLFHVNTALFAKAGLMRGGKPVLPNSADELLAAGAAVRAAHGQALSHPEQRRRSGLRRAQPLHLHDGAGRGAVSRREAHPAEHAHRRRASPITSAASMSRSSARRTWTRRRRSPRSSAARAASIRPAPG